MPANNTELEKRLWGAADELRANSKLKSSEYSVPVLGLIFLRYADYKFSQAEKKLEEEQKTTAKRRKGITKVDYQARGVMYIPPEARWTNLMQLPENANIGKEINDKMRAIEAENDDLKDVLPKTYNRLDNRVLIALLKNLNSIPLDIEGDAFGKIYEYFLGNFAMAEGQKGGEFFTPISIVKLIVEIIEPYHGRIYDPACGSGGMFVQSANFIERHQASAQFTGTPMEAISIFGQERVAETVRLCKMNLAVHGLGGDIRQANSYYEDLHNSPGKFDFVMANPPFNVDKVDKDRIKDDTVRFPFGIPSPDNANYLWIQLFYSALNKKGRAGFIMANSASDARGSEMEIRKRLIKTYELDVIIIVGSNFFYTVTLPCTLWFLDRGKKRTDREDKVLFLDARQIYRQLDRAHRDFSSKQISFLSSIVRLYRGEDLSGYKFNAEGLDLTEPQIEQFQQIFDQGIYRDVSGFCKVASIEEISAQGWSINPGRFVGVADQEDDEFNFGEKILSLSSQLDILNIEANEFQDKISNNINELMNTIE
jgi:type I restriction enzyme M protein